MSMTLGSLINSDGISETVEVTANFGEFEISTKDLERTTGWVLKPEGLCRGEICVPIRDPQTLSHDNQIDLDEFARLLNLNILVDPKHAVAALGERAETRSEAMSSLDAPDFTLPDIHGRQVSFSDFNRRKRLLLAWSSW